MSMAQQNGIEQDASERGIPGATPRKKSRARLFFVLLVVVGLLLAAAGFISMTLNRFTAAKMEEKAEKKKVQEEKSKAQTSEPTDLSKETQKIIEERKASEAAAQANLATPAGVGPTQPNGAYPPKGASAPTAQYGNQAPAQPADVPRRYNGDVTIATGEKDSVTGKGGGTLGVADALEAMKKAQDGMKSASSLTSAKPNSLEERLTPSSLPPAKASFLPNLDYLLGRGIIPCGVPVQVNTTHPGAVKCTVLSDVYSKNLKTLLIRRGADVYGEQRQALLQGQAVIFILWTDIEDGKVTIPVNSPATNSLGATGLEAYVDNHFFQRFGGSIMVSLVGDFGQALANRSVGNGSGQVSFSNSSNATQSAAEEVLRSSINIPPTAYSQQGAVTNIFVSRNVDFSNVYEVVKHD